MIRKGDIHWNYIIGAVLGGVVLFLIFTGAWKTIQPIVFAVELIGFNVSNTQGNGIIGLNLQSGNLEYYTGESFKKFTNQEVAVLGGYGFNVADTKNKLNDFYFKTERRPAKLSIEVNHWRYWDVSLGNSNNMAFIVNFKNKGSFDNLLFNSLEYAELDSNGKPVFFGSYDASNFPSFGKIEFEENSDKVASLIAWRDSILQGNSCEKFLTLRVRQNGAEKDLEYTVRKSDNYLVIDLTKPIEFGVDKWSNEKCFNVDSYVDIPIELKDYYLSLDLYDEITYRTLRFFFNSSGWELPYYNTYVSSKWYTGWTGQGQETKVRYTLSETELRSLLFGINRIIETGVGDIRDIKISLGSELFGERENKVLLKEFILKRYDQFSKEDLEKKNPVLYDLLDSYTRLIITGVPA